MEEMSSGGKAPSSMVYIGIGRKWFFCDLESQQRPAAPISLCVKSFRAYDMLQQKKVSRTHFNIKSVFFYENSHDKGNCDAILSS